MMASVASTGSWTLPPANKGEVKGKSKGEQKGKPKEGPAKARPKKKLPQPLAKTKAEPPDDGGDDDYEYEYTYESYSEAEENNPEEETATNDPTLRSSQLSSRAASVDESAVKREQGSPPKTKARTAAKSKLTPSGSAPGSVRGSVPGSVRGSAAASSDGSANTDEVRQLLQKSMKRQAADRGRPNLTSVKLDQFRGNRTAYKDWKKTLKAQQALYKLTEEELAVLVYLNTAGEARDIVNQLEIEDLQEPGGLGRIMRLLDDAYEKRADERFEQKQEEFQTYRRAHGVSIAAYLSKLKRLKDEYLREDTETKISDKSFAQRMLARAALSKRERMEVFFASGGKYRSDRIEKVLRFRHANLHVEEAEKYQSRGAQGDLRYRPAKKTYRQSRGHGGYGKRRHGAHVAEAGEGETKEEEETFEEEEDDEDLDNEDLEQEAYPADARGEQWDDDETEQEE